MDERITRMAAKVEDKKDEALSKQVSSVDGAVDEAMSGIQKLYYGLQELAKDEALERNEKSAVQQSIQLLEEAVVPYMNDVDKALEIFETEEEG